MKLRLSNKMIQTAAWKRMRNFSELQLAHVFKKTGGFSRISQFVKDAIEEKDSNVLFLDGGDLSHGSLPLVSSKGSALLPILNKMKLDGFVLELA